MTTSPGGKVGQKASSAPVQKSEVRRRSQEGAEAWASGMRREHVELGLWNPLCPHSGEAVCSPEGDFGGVMEG